MLGERYDGIVCSTAGPATTTSTRPTVNLLGAPTPRLHRPQRTHGRTKRGRKCGTGRRARPVRRLGGSSSRTTTEPRLKRESHRSRRSSAPSSSTPPARAPRPSTTASSRATCSNAGSPSRPRPHRQRRADQRPCRTRPPRRRHLPQALTRHPIRTRRTQPRTTALPPRSPAGSQAIALPLPHRGHDRPRPRRPDTRPQLTTQRTERLPHTPVLQVFLRPIRDSNPCRRRERAECTPSFAGTLFPAERRGQILVKMMHHRIVVDGEHELEFLVEISLSRRFVPVASDQAAPAQKVLPDTST